MNAASGVHCGRSGAVCISELRSRIREYARESAPVPPPDVVGLLIGCLFQNLSLAITY